MRAVRLLLPAVALLFASSLFAQSLPQDASPTCIASSMNSWFQSGTITVNGVVNPANSLTLDTSTNCNFYLWSQQMFLWLTSPAPAGYGGSGRVFDSNVFYEVTEAVNGKRYFVPHIILPNGAGPEAKARRVNLRPGKPGPNGFPAVIDRQGNIIEVVPAQIGGTRKPLLMSQAGKKVEVARVGVSPEKRAVFYDAAGKVIPQPKLILPAKVLKNSRLGQRFFTADNTPVIVGPDGVIFDVSPGQAGGAGVLLSQNSSVVYYSIATNDVYTYFASGVNSGKISATQFPTTQADLNTIQSYAGQTFTDGIALAVEVKMSWVDVSAVPNPANYITTPAIVPVYDTSNPNLWKPTGEKLATLALVGVHFVGSAKGHPEMIWSTFEHFGNSPNGAYQYVNTANQTVTVPASSAGTWLFSSANSGGPFNVMHADYLTAPNIESANGFTISASDTQRVYPFGVAPTGVPNQNDATPAIANTEVISVNNSVLSQLASGDVRANYYFVGSTWTFGGYAPTGPYSPSSPNQNGAEIGTDFLTNSTMETYHQASGSNPSTNCFSCHNVGGGPSAPGTPATTAVSHIFGSLQPLGTANAAATAKPTRTRMKKN
jgi:hypothetical protein